MNYVQGDHVHAVRRRGQVRPGFGIAALVLAGVPFFVGGMFVIEAETPSSGAPLLGILSHALWALDHILALGVAALLRAVPALRRGLAGYPGAGVLGLGVLAGLQWVTWAFVDVRGARDAERGDVVLDAIVVPFRRAPAQYAILLEITTLLLPVPYPWATAAGIATYRRR